MTEACATGVIQGAGVLNPLSKFTKFYRDAGKTLDSFSSLREVSRVLVCCYLCFRQEPCSPGSSGVVLAEAPSPEREPALEERGLD